MFTGRDDPSGRDEQYERFFIVLVNADPTGSWFEYYNVGDPTKSVSLDDVFDEAIELIAERNPDFYEIHNNRIRRF